MLDVLVISSATLTVPTGALVSAPVTGALVTIPAKSLEDSGAIESVLNKFVAGESLPTTVELEGAVITRTANPVIRTGANPVFATPILLIEDYRDSESWSELTADFDPANETLEDYLDEVRDGLEGIDPATRLGFTVAGAFKTTDIR